MSIQAPASAQPAVRDGRRHRDQGGLLPMVCLRAALLRVRHQLHRSAGHRHPQAHAAAAVRLERARLWRHRVFVSARLRDRVSVRRTAHGPPGHAGGVLDCDRHMEPRGDGPCVGPVFWRYRRGVAVCSRPDLQRLGRRLHRRAVCAGPRRGRKLPRRHKNGSRMVPAQRARVRDRHLQRGHQHRRAADAADRSDHHAVVWMGMGVHCDGRARVPLARTVVDVVSLARGSSACQQGRARIHPQRSARADDEDVVGHDPSASPGVDVRRREVHDRSGVVAVSLLDSRLPLSQLRPESHDDGAADRGDLSDRRRWQRGRRVVVVDADQARLDGECRAQDGDAGVRAGGDADRVCGAARRICGLPSG